MESKTYNYLKIGKSIFSGLGIILIIQFVKDYFVQFILFSLIFTIDAILIYWKNSSNKKQGKPLDTAQPFLFWMNSFLALAGWGLVVYYYSL